MLRWIRLTALVAAVETQASPVKPASGWSAIRAWPWSRRVGSSSDASGLLFPTAVAPHGDVDYGLRGAQHRWLTWRGPDPRRRFRTNWPDYRIPLGPPPNLWKFTPVTNLVCAAGPNAPSHSSVTVWTEPGRAWTAGCVRETDGR